jgi:hypothetical protein
VSGAILKEQTTPQRQSKLHPTSRPLRLSFHVLLSITARARTHTHTNTDLGGWSISGKCWSSCKTATRSAVPAPACPSTSAQEHTADNKHATVSIKRDQGPTQPTGGTHARLCQESCSKHQRKHVAPGSCLLPRKHLAPRSATWSRASRRPWSQTISLIHDIPRAGTHVCSDCNWATAADCSMQLLASCHQENETPGV